MQKLVGIALLACAIGVASYSLSVHFDTEVVENCLTTEEAAAALTVLESHGINGQTLNSVDGFKELRVYSKQTLDVLSLLNSADVVQAHRDVREGCSEVKGHVY